MEAIRCDRLTKTFGKVVALNQLDLAVEDGVVFGFLGPNGAGKTTAVRMLTGLSKPTAGRAWVAGEDVNPHSMAFRSGIGYLPEEPAFYNWMTAAEFIAFVGRLFGLATKIAQRRADELIDVVGLREVRNRRIGGFSRGMRQRLGLAQAMVNQPKVLFLDEPCSALDPIGRREVLELIGTLRSQATIFMSTHILSDVERVCDRVAVVDHGRLIVNATVAQLRERYARPMFDLRFAEDAEDFRASLATVPWVDRVEHAENGVIRVIARDESFARSELPAKAVASGLTLVSYEVASPSLEDIFVALVGKKDVGGEE